MVRITNGRPRNYKNRSRSIRIEIDEQNKWLRKEIDHAKAKMAAVHTLRSSMTIRIVYDLCRDSLKNRAQLIWQTLFRFITTAGISYSGKLSLELKELTAQHLPATMNDFDDHILQITGLSGSPKMFGQLKRKLDSEREQALAKVGTEIDLSAHFLKRKTDQMENGSSSTVNYIYAPAGSILTGNGSIAYINQTIDTDVKERISNVLQEIFIKLEKSEVKTPTPKDELIEIVKESKNELQKDKPNTTRLKSLLASIGTSIQVVSSLKPAYETLKQVLTLIGISLP